MLNLDTMTNQLGYFMAEFLLNSSCCPPCVQQPRGGRLCTARWEERSLAGLMEKMSGIEVYNG